MSKEKTINLSLQNLTNRQIWALAEFVKRVRFTDMQNRSADEQEAEDMRIAFVELREALAKQGFEPR